jgi:hypothetical protein
VTAVLYQVQALGGEGLNLIGRRWLQYAELLVTGGPEAQKHRWNR